eukprot:2046210-Prymnesium_polylepis.1
MRCVCPRRGATAGGGTSTVGGPVVAQFVPTPLHGSSASRPVATRPHSPRPASVATPRLSPLPAGRYRPRSGMTIRRATTPR